MEAFTVFGFWAETQERYGQFYRATSARAAEDLARLDAADKGGTLLVARVVAGEVSAADLYTLFVDPADSRNDDSEDIEPDVAGFADDEWTVFGIAVPAGGTPEDGGGGGERYGDVINATSPLAAEDVARARLADEGGELMVCTVLAGRVAAADTYASFVNPDLKASA